MDKYTTGGVLNNDLTFQNWTLLPTNDDKPANAETVRSPFRVVSDRSRYLMNEVSWRRPRATVRVENGTDIKVERLSGVAIYDPIADKWYLFRSPVAGPFDLTLTPGALAINTWFYLYAKQAAGALQFELSNVAPDILLTGKAGDLALRYLCSIRSDGAGNMIRGRYVDGEWTYEGRQQLGGFTAPTNFADPNSVINAAPRVPPHCRLVRIIWNANNFDLPNIHNCTLRKNNGTDTWFFQNPAFNNYGFLDMVLDDQQRFQSIISLNTNSQSHYVVGYRES